MRNRLILCLACGLATTPFCSSQNARFLEQSAAPGQVETLSPVPLQIFAGKSLLIDTTAPVKRASISDSNIADAQVITPTQVLVDGRSPGQTTLLVWDAQEHWRAYDVTVKLDVVEVVEEIKEIFPDQQINVPTAGSAVVLSGYVSSWEVAQRAGMVARAYNKNVVNALTYPPHLPW